MQKILVNCGFTETDAQVYVFLATESPQKASDVARALKLSRKQAYRILKNLQSKGVLKASPGYPARFSALVFEKALDILIEVKMEQQKALQASKKELLSTWRSITEKNCPNS
jgi:sugar-specific transcriptional regulator TrmB